MPGASGCSLKGDQIGFSGGTGEYAVKDEPASANA
jgi:hypothetical protein